MRHRRRVLACALAAREPILSPLASRASKLPSRLAHASGACTSFSPAPAHHLTHHAATRARAVRRLRENVPVHRISFSEITEAAVQAALAAPRRVNFPLVRAQQARQAVDYLVGFTLSPVLWRKLPGCRSAGRVQSVALRLIVEREHEILRFEPQEHWSLKVALLPSDGDGGTPMDGPDARDTWHGTRQQPMLAEVTHVDGTKLTQFSLPDEHAVAAMRARLPPSWRVHAVKRSERQTTPPPPYNTASLQQDASRRLGLGVGRVMRLAQSLYEGVALDGAEPVALITYMRTDGIEMSAEGLASARQYVASAFGQGEEWLPPTPRVFKSRTRNAQEAHEAIRPVDFSLDPLSLRGRLADAELRLYELIWRRAVGSQMAAARNELLTITLVPQSETARGSAEGAVMEGATEPSTATATGAEPPAAMRARTSGSRQLLPGFRALLELPRAVPKRAADDADSDDEGMRPVATADGADAGAGTLANISAGAGRSIADEADSDDAANSLAPLLDSLSEGDTFVTSEVLPKQQFTQPPPRFNEGSLVRHLEELGIGRPSTYASILKALQVRRNPRQSRLCVA